MNKTSLLLGLILLITNQAAYGLDLSAEAKVTQAGGQIALIVSGKTTWQTKLEGVAQDKKISLEKFELKDDLFAVHAKAEAAKGQKREAVLLWQRGTKKMKIIWQQDTSLKGDVGERIGQAVRFDDLTDDGLVEVQIGQVSEAVHLCGSPKLPLLFRKVYDTQKGVFREILARRPNLPDPIELIGVYTPGKGPIEPLVKQVSADAVSRQVGDRGEAILLGVPGVLLDGDPTTSWSPIPGNGAGEFVSFHNTAGNYGLSRIGIVPFDKKGKKTLYDKPRALLLTTEKKVFRLLFTEDLKGNNKSPVWFDLPAPEITRCLSLIVESTYKPSPKRYLALGEIKIITEADFKGVGGLALDLSDVERRRQAAMLLKTIGKPAVKEIAKVWPKLNIQAQRLAVDVLASFIDKEGIPILVEAAVSNDEITRETARRGLNLADMNDTMPLIEKLLETDDEIQFERTVDLLGSLKNNWSLIPLMNAAGRGGRQRRTLIRSRLVLAAERSEEGRVKLLSRMQQLSVSDEREKLFDLIRAGSHFEDLREPVSEIAIQIYDENGAFNDRYRALEVIGRTGTEAGDERLVSALKDSDALIRSIAAIGFGAAINMSQDKRAMLFDALKDPEPIVRLACLRAIGQLGLSPAAFTELESLIDSETWPDVRALITEIARYLPTERAASILEKAAVDDSVRVRGAALGSAALLKGPRIDKIVEDFLVNSKELPRIKTVAAMVAGQRCQRSALPALTEVVQKGAEPLADSEDISAALSAIRAIASIGGKEAKSILEKARKRSNPATDRAIDAAIKKELPACENSRDAQ